MLLRNLNTNAQSTSTILSDLNDGLPTIGALARLCGHAISGETLPIETLSDEAKALLSLGRQRGVFEIRCNKDAFESSQRFLAVCVEVDEDRYLILRDKSRPRVTLKFLDAFRELCQSGLMIHHTQRDFSLTHRGFDSADELAPNQFSELIAFAHEAEH